MPEIPVEALTGCLGGLRKAVLAVPAVRTAQWTKFKPVRQVRFHCLSDILKRQKSYILLLVLVLHLD